MKVKITQEHRYAIDLGIIHVADCKKLDCPSPGLAVYRGTLAMTGRPTVDLVVLEGSPLQALAPLFGLDSEVTLIAAPREVLECLEAAELTPQFFGMPERVGEEFEAAVKSLVLSGEPLRFIKERLASIKARPGDYTKADSHCRLREKRLAEAILKIRGQS